MALEDREEAVPCADFCDSIGNGIDYFSWIWGCVSVYKCRHHRVCTLLKDETSWWIYGDKMDAVQLCWVFWMIHGDDKH